MALFCYLVCEMVPLVLSGSFTEEDIALQLSLALSLQLVLPRLRIEFVYLQDHLFSFRTLQIFKRIHVFL